jgi:hypothetical protein
VRAGAGVSAGRCIVCPTGRVEEDGDKLCRVCALDVAESADHSASCECGRCAVLARAESFGSAPWTWQEARRADRRRPAEELAAYLARRDAAPVARIVLDVPRELAHQLHHAVTTIGARLVSEPGRCDAERAVAVRLSSSRLEGV